MNQQKEFKKYFEQLIKHENDSAEKIQKVFRGSKVRKNVVRDIIPPAKLSILNESDEKVNDDESKKNDNQNHSNN